MVGVAGVEATTPRPQTRAAAGFGDLRGVAGSAGGSVGAGDLIDRLRAVVRSLLASGPPPLPPDLCAELQQLAARGNDATRTLLAAKQESARAGGSSSTPDSEGVRRGEG